MKLRAHSIAAFCAILFLAIWGVWPNTAPGATDDSVPREEAGEEIPEVEPAFRIIGLDDRAALRDSVRLASMRARRTIFQKTDIDWEGTALIIWADANLYREKTGFEPESTAAAAAPDQMTIYINAGAWAAADEQSQQQTMTHEVAHLLLGSLPGGRHLPLWANEGIVMHLAGQWSYDEQMKLLAAHAIGSLPRLKDLEVTFPRGGGDAQSLAYRMSYAAISVVSQSFGDRPGSVRRLVQGLADDFNGPLVAREFSDDFRVEGWQLATEHALGSRYATAIIVLTGTSSVFLIITIIAIVAFLRIKAKNAARRRELDEEEAWAESLTEDDVQDIYGDRDERWREDE